MDLLPTKRKSSIKGIDEELSNPTDRRIFAIAEAFTKNYTIDEIYDKTKIDRWFLQKLKNIFELKNELETIPSLEELPVELLKMVKQSWISLIFRLPVWF
jgi:carbamoyl-phosphate synthase large subunit